MRITQVFAAAAAVVAAGAAQADIYIIDDFNAPYVAVFDTDVRSGQVSAGTNTQSSNVGDGVVGGDGLLATARNMYTDAFIPGCTSASAAVGSCAAGNAAGAKSSFGVGPNPNFYAEALNTNVGSGFQTYNIVKWTLDNAALSAALMTGGPVALYFNIIESNLANVGGSAVATEVKFALNDVEFKTVTLGQINFPGQVVQFDLTPAEVTSLLGGSTLSMAMTSSGVAWDLSIDAFGLIVPEPTSLALAGLALVGAGIAARRRKA